MGQVEYIQQTQSSLNVAQEGEAQTQVLVGARDQAGDVYRMWKEKERKRGEKSLKFSLGRISAPQRIYQDNEATATVVSLELYLNTECNGSGQKTKPYQYFLWSDRLTLVLTHSLKSGVHIIG